MEAAPSSNEYCVCTCKWENFIPQFKIQNSKSQKATTNFRLFFEKKMNGGGLFKLCEETIGGLLNTLLIRKKFKNKIQNLKGWERGEAVPVFKF